MNNRNCSIDCHILYQGEIQSRDLLIIQLQTEILMLKQKIRQLEGENATRNIRNSKSIESFNSQF